MRSSPGSARIGAPRPVNQTNQHQHQQQLHHQQKEREAQKRMIEEQLAALKRQLMEFEPSEEEDTAKEEEQPSEEKPIEQQTSDSNVETNEKQDDDKAAPSEESSVPPLVPISSNPDTEPVPMAVDETASLESSSSPNLTSTSVPSSSVVDLTSDPPSTPASTKSRASKKRKSIEPSEVKDEAAKATDGDAVIVVDTNEAAAAASESTPADDDSSDPSSAKKAKTSSSTKKPKETPEEREAKKAAEKARKAAELEQKKLEKERERAEAKEAARREAEAKRLEKQRELEEKKAEKLREAEEKKEAARREAEAKKVEKQRELDAKKAEKEAKDKEKQKELEAKLQLKAEQEKKAEQKKLDLEKSKALMNSFFKFGSATKADKESTPSLTGESASSVDLTNSSTMAASSSSNSALTSSVPISSLSSLPSPSLMKSSTHVPTERELLKSAAFLPYTPDTRVWSREHGRLSSEERSRLSAMTDIDFQCSGGVLSNAIPNWLDDAKRVEAAQTAGKRRRQHFAQLLAKGPTVTKKKLLQFHDNYRPAWYGRMRKTLLGEVSAPSSHMPVSAVASAPAAPCPTRYRRRPLVHRPTERWSNVDPNLLNYDIDSDDEWGEEPDDGEELDSADDEDSESDSESEDETGDGWLVPKSEDPLADIDQQKGQLRDVTMVPIIVGPIKDLARIAELYTVEQSRLKQEPTFQPTLHLTEEMKDMIMLRKRYINGMEHLTNVGILPAHSFCLI